MFIMHTLSLSNLLIINLVLKCLTLFSINVFFQTVRHGFPYQPTALAFDPVQKILAIGSRSGGVRMYPFCGVFMCSPYPVHCTVG